MGLFCICFDVSGIFFFRGFFIPDLFKPLQGLFLLSEKSGCPADHVLHRSGLVPFMVGVDDLVPTACRKGMAAYLGGVPGTGYDQFPAQDPDGHLGILSSKGAQRKREKIAIKGNGIVLAHRIMG